MECLLDVSSPWSSALLPFCLGACKKVPLYQCLRQFSASPGSAEMNLYEGDIVKLLSKDASGERKTHVNFLHLTALPQTAWWWVD